MPTAKRYLPPAFAFTTALSYSLLESAHQEQSFRWQFPRTGPLKICRPEPTVDGRRELQVDDRRESQSQWASYT